MKSFNCISCGNPVTMTVEKWEENCRPDIVVCGECYKNRLPNIIAQDIIKGISHVDRAAEGL